MQRRETERKLRVAIMSVIPPSVGGIASWTRRLMDSPELADDVDFCLIDERLSGGRSTFGQETKRSLRDEAGRCLRIWRDLRRALDKQGCSIVHANIPAFSLSMCRELVSAYIVRGKGAAFVIHLHCTVPVAAASKTSRGILKLLLSKSSAVIVLNKPSEDFVKSLSDVSVYRIPNFVSLREGEQGISQRNYARPLRSVLYAGGLVEGKGIYDVLETAKRFPNVQFRLAGEGTLEGSQVPSNVALLGVLNRHELEIEYSTADAFIFLSHFRGEGFSCSLLEAMASGLPCVVTDWAANAEMVGEDGGFVVPVGNVEATVDALRALDDGSLRKAMGERNQRIARELYGEDITVGKIVEVYREAGRHR